MIVDAYSHVCPERFLDAIEELHPTAEAAALRKNSYLFDAERRLGYMDRIGVDQHGSAAAMRCGLEFFGAQQVMYGTDFPMGPSDGEQWPVEVLDAIRSLGLGPADLDNVLAGNALRILRL